MQNKNTNPSFSNLFNQPSELLTREQAAEYLGVTARTLAVWACVKRYPLPYVKVGRLVKYRRSDLDDFIARRTVIQQEI
ncbi:MAG: helix-turn-helix domain-containing protein [Coxiellaceae bacterium]|nr:MAG: helix-turn-helix domain-containing protein [Coxiellaceae bacterium]